jgi:hypothetical protein
VKIHGISAFKYPGSGCRPGNSPAKPESFVQQSRQLAAVPLGTVTFDHTGRLRRVNIHGKIVAVADRPPYAADDLLEQLRAESRLANMDLAEDLASVYETEATQALRARYADAYLRCVGVVPEQRSDFREALQWIVAGGRQSVADVIEGFRRERHANGSLSPFAD